MSSKKSTLLLILSLLAINASHGATIQFGDLLISEIMANPSAVSDGNGEWFEIFNASANTINLNGLIISDDGSNSHQINNGGSLFILPGEYFVLGRNGDILSNGGYIADYVYTNFSLSNSSDQIALFENNMEVARLNYTGPPFGTSGASAELIAQSLILSESDYQLTTGTTYGAGDFGTPGSQGSFKLTSATTVPVPGAIWLFASALIVGARSIKFRTENYSRNDSELIC